MPNSLTPDEVVARLAAEDAPAPTEKLGLGIHAVMYSGEPVGPLTIKTIRDLARQLLACRRDAERLSDYAQDLVNGVQTFHGPGKLSDQMAKVIVQVGFVRRHLPEHAGGGE